MILASEQLGVGIARSVGLRESLIVKCYNQINQRLWLAIVSINTDAGSDTRSLWFGIVYAGMCTGDDWDLRKMWKVLSLVATMTVVTSIQETKPEAKVSVAFCVASAQRPADMKATGI